MRGLLDGRLVKEKGGTESTVKPTNWAVNESSRLMSLFIEPSVLDSVSRICDGLKDRSELDRKDLRQAAWKHLHLKYHDEDWKPTTPVKWEDDPDGGLTHKINPGKYLNNENDIQYVFIYTHRCFDVQSYNF